MKTPPHPHPPLLKVQFVLCIFCRAPFDVSLTVLVTMIVLVYLTWTENYGDQTVNTSQSFKNAFSAIRTGET